MTPATLKDFLGFVVNPPPGDPSRTAGSDQTSAAVAYASSERFDPRTYGAAGDGVTDDTAAMQATIAHMTAGATLDLAGLTYLVSAPVSFNVAGITAQNGTITSTVAGTPAVQVIAANVTFRSLTVNASYAYGTNWTVTSDRLAAVSVNATGFLSFDCNYAGGYLACVYLANGNCNGSKIVRGSTTQTNLAQNSCGIQVAAGANGNYDITVEDVDVVGAGGAYNTGTPAAANGVLMFDCNRGKVRNCRVRNCTRLPTLTISNGGGSSHGSTALWSLVSGTTWQARLASGTAGVSGPATDRNDGATRVVKLDAAQISEDGATPSTPGAGKWGISGGFIYYNASGTGFTDPNNHTFTSDTVSGYGITFYNTTSGFIDPSNNTAEANEVYNCDGFGIYMQQGGGNGTPGTLSYGTGNSTRGNNLVNCALQGTQDVGLPFAALGWNGGQDSLSAHDTIRNTGGSIGSPGVNVIQGAGIYLSSGRVIGVQVDGPYSQGFRHTADGGWTYVGCRAAATTSHGIYAVALASATLRNLSYIGCATTGCGTAGGQGMYLDGTGAGSTLQVNVTGGSHRNAGLCSIRIDNGKDCNIVGVDSNNPGQFGTGQAHFRAVSPSLRVNFTGNHFVNGSASSVGVQVDAGCLNCTATGNTGAGVTTSLSLGAGVVVRISGNDLANGISDYVGMGVPTAGGTNLIAPIGSTYRNVSGAAGSCFYVSQTGAAAGWLALA